MTVEDMMLRQRQEEDLELDLEQQTGGPLSDSAAAKVPLNVSFASPIKRSGSFRHNKDTKRSKTNRWLILVLKVAGALALVLALRFLFAKCDTREPMADMLTKTTKILQRNNIEYWLDKGTLLGVFRENKGLIPWEYDVDLGVRNATCDQISSLKHEFEAVGLRAYNRSDYIAHKVKLTYDTENHHFYWSDPRLHDPCIRVYDARDTSTWVDIYWYEEFELKTPEEVDAARIANQMLIPEDFDVHKHGTKLLCCSEGLAEYTEHMCCGGCVPSQMVFPLKTMDIAVPDGDSLMQNQFVPNAMAEFLAIQYGPTALTTREIKGWKGIVCGYWTSPILFVVHVLCLNVVLIVLVLYCRRRGPSKPLRFSKERRA